MASVNDVVVRTGMEGPIGRETNDVYREALDVLSMPNRPTALVCGNDEMALQGQPSRASPLPSQSHARANR
jgi:DNA-binding LacI/PurR family transcriptional regulator